MKRVQSIKPYNGRLHVRYTKEPKKTKKQRKPQQKTKTPQPKPKFPALDRRLKEVEKSIKGLESQVESYFPQYQVYNQDSSFNDTEIVRKQIPYVEHISQIFNPLNYHPVQTILVGESTMDDISPPRKWSKCIEKWRR